MKVLFVDDDKCFIKEFVPKVETLLQHVFKKYTLDIICEDFTNINGLSDYDIIFLDIDLNNEYINGLKIASYIKNGNEDAIIIFVSNRVGLVHKALEVQPTYFIRKNNLLKDMKVLSSIIKRIFKKRSDAIIFEYRGRKTSLFINDIIYAESLGHNIMLHTSNNSYEFRSNFQSLYKKFSQVKFSQIHKSYAININKILEIRKKEIVLEGNVILPLGRKYREKVVEDYKESLLYDF